MHNAFYRSETNDPNGKGNTSWEMQQGRLLPDAKANARMLGIEADADM